MHCHPFTSILAASVLALAASAALISGRSSAAPAPSMLHAQGAQIVNAFGQPIALRGINLGGWLVEEPWMEPFVVDPPAGSPYPPNEDHVKIWSTAKARFGAAGMQQIRDAFRSAWITPADFDRMHDAGMNCVRVPFLSSLVDEPNGLRWLDDAVAWAGQRHMYVILDMHGAPGSQSDQAHTGHKGVPEFFTKGANVRSAMTIWAQIAARYKNNPVVAGYDLINEPMATPTSDTLYVVENRLYQSIRAVDPNHIIIMEDGYSGAQWMPFPIPAGWNNVVYSTHYYDFPAKTEQDQADSVSGYLNNVEKESKRRDIPWYVGEFGFEPNGTPAVLAQMLGTAKRDGLAATMWSYKCTWGDQGQQNLWGLYSNTKPISKLNMFTDSKAELIAKCAQFRTENLTPNTGALEAFRSAAGSGAPTFPTVASAR